MEHKHYGRAALREVSYSLEPLNVGFNPDCPGNNNHLKGYFHTWGLQPAKNPLDDSCYLQTVAIIEDAETGIVEEIPTEQFYFIDIPNT